MFLAPAPVLKSRAHLSESAVVFAGTNPRHMSSKSSSSMSKSNILLELGCEWVERLAIAVNVAVACPLYRFDCEACTF